MKYKVLVAIAVSFLLSLSVGAQNLRLLVGTYTENTGAEGVYLYSFDTETAACELVGCSPAGNPSFVIASPDGNTAYSVNEFNDGRQAVSSFALDGWALGPATTVPIPKELVDGGDPCNLLQAGNTLISSNYTGGTLTAFSLGRDGGIGQMVQHFDGNRYSEVPGADAPNPAHIHCAALSPDGKYIFVTDLGNDRILKFSKEGGTFQLTQATTAWQEESPQQFGPRHLTFSRDGRFAYLICELSDKLVVFSYRDGVLSPIQTIMAYNGKGHGSADIHISPDGRFLYTSHRLKKDGIAIFAINGNTGKVRKVGFTRTGRHPRNFAISPDGHFLLCACRDDNRIEIYAIDQKTGHLSPAREPICVSAPVCVQFVPFD